MEKVELKRGTKIVKRRGAPGPVRTVTGWPVKYCEPVVRVRYTLVTKRHGKQTLTEDLLVDEATGLPAGYVLAKDRKAKKAGAK